jgi:hypothetical protein
VNLKHAFRADRDFLSLDGSAREFQIDVCNSLIGVQLESVWASAAADRAPAN